MNNNNSQLLKFIKKKFININFKTLNGYFYFRLLIIISLYLYYAK